MPTCYGCGIEISELQFPHCNACYDRLKEALKRKPCPPVACDGQTRDGRCTIDVACRKWPLSRWNRFKAYECVDWCSLIDFNEEPLAPCTAEDCR